MKTSFYKTYKYELHPCTSEYSLNLFTVPGICPLECEYCDVKDFKSLDTYTKSELDIVLQTATLHNKVESVIISGGEPTSFTVFLSYIVDYIENYYKVPVWVKTNGVLYDHIKDVVDVVNRWIVRIKMPCDECMHLSRSDVYSKILFDREDVYATTLMNYCKNISKTLELFKNKRKTFCVVIEKHPDLLDDELECMVKFATRYTNSIVIEDITNGNILHVR